MAVPPLRMIFPGLIIAFLRPLSRESGVSGKRGQGPSGPARRFAYGALPVFPCPGGAGPGGFVPGGPCPAAARAHRTLAPSRAEIRQRGGSAGDCPAFRGRTERAKSHAPRPAHKKNRRTRVGAAVLQMLKVRKELTSVPPWRQPLPASSSSRRRRPWKQPPSGSWERCRPGPSLPSGPDR